MSIEKHEIIFNEKKYLLEYESCYDNEITLEKVAKLIERVIAGRILGIEKIDITDMVKIFFCEADDKLSVNGNKGKMFRILTTGKNFMHIFITIDGKCYKLFNSGWDNVEKDAISDLEVHVSVTLYINKEIPIDALKAIHKTLERRC